MKKIINSYAAGRPASDASLLSLGLRPAKRSFKASSPVIHHDDSPSTSNASAMPQALTNDFIQRETSLDPLPPETEPPAPSRGSLMDRQSNGSTDRRESFKAHRDVFFFTLQRELEKVKFQELKAITNARFFFFFSSKSEIYS